MPTVGPKVSIVMAAHNAESTIGLALSSLLLQRYQNWECLVVDDGSTDRTGAILSELKDVRFKIQGSVIPLGRAGARNLALDLASGKYLASLDSDDFLFPRALESQVLELESNPALSACTGSLLLFSDEGHLLGRRRTQLGPGIHRLAPPLSTRLPLGSTMLRLNDVGKRRFKTSLRRTEDREFFERVLKGSTVKVLHQPTYAYRWRPSVESVLEGLRNRITLYRNNPNLPQSQLLMIYTALKLICYPVIHRLGMWDLLNGWRIVSPGAKDLALFARTQNRLRLYSETIWAGPQSE